MIESNTPMVSVFMMVYNHEKFIEQAIEGVLMQKTNFDFVIVLGEDCSADNSREIILRYTSVHPEKFKLLLNDSNLGAMANQLAILNACKGKYIAFCEGDDYWTDPYKLQKQVDFLEANEEYSICFHRYKILDEESNKYRDDGCGFLFDNEKLNGVTIDVNQFLNDWVTQPLTMVLRNECLDITLASKYKHYRDIHIIYHILQNGKGYIFSFEGGIYREHLGGTHSKQTLMYQSENGLAVAKELYFVNGTDSLKNNFLRILQWHISTLMSNHVKKIRVLRYIFEHFYYSVNFKRFLKNFKYLFHN
ncbi:MAG: glycosyltransferase [Paludibacter sp.]|nr:glycosyltransferase [Paludibacter sp.]